MSSLTALPGVGAPEFASYSGLFLFLNPSSGADLGQELAPREAELPVLNWARIPACRGRMLKFGAGFRPRSGAGFRPRLGPDAGPDLGPDSGPELAGCFIFGTDSGPDLRPDSGPQELIIIEWAGFRPRFKAGFWPSWGEIRLSGPNSRPDSGPDIRPESGPGANSGRNQGRIPAGASGGVRLKLEQTSVGPGWGAGFCF